MHRILWALAALLLIPLAGCAGGPGTTGDSCAIAEATPIGAGSQAAAASASGGQRANQAPFADDTARLAPQTTIGRGEGPTTASSADAENREVASGGAQNLGVIIPTGAEASTGGGTPPAVIEAAKTVAILRTSLQCALADPTCPTDKIAFISDALSKAQESLAVAQASATVSRVVNYNFQSSRNTQVGLSTSKTGNQDALDPEVAAQLSEAAGRVVEAGTAVYEDDASADSDSRLEPESPVEGPTP